MAGGALDPIPTRTSGVATVSLQTRLSQLLRDSFDLRQGSAVEFGFRAITLRDGERSFMQATSRYRWTQRERSIDADRTFRTARHPPCGGHRLPAMGTAVGGL